MCFEDISQSRLDELCWKCVPRKFAVRIATMIFTTEELLTRKCREGSKGRQMLLCRDRLNKIKDCVVRMYDIPHHQVAQVWLSCTVGIDQRGRDMARAQRRKYEEMLNPKPAKHGKNRKMAQHLLPTDLSIIEGEINLPLIGNVMEVLPSD